MKLFPSRLGVASLFSQLLGKDAMHLRPTHQVARTIPAAAALRNKMLPILFSLALVLVTGCATTQYVSVRPTPSNALATTLNLLDKPKVTPRTEQYLRRYDIVIEEETKTQDILKKLQENLIRDPSPDACEAFSEIAYLGGLKIEKSNPKEALHLFGAAVTHSYYYLFDPRFAQFRNPYDPQFRQVCDIYNQSLESCLRLMKEDKKIHSACAETFVIGDQTLDIKIEIKNGPWEVEEIQGIEFCSDYEVKGLPNKYRTFGLGVPLIVKRKPVEPLRASEKYHPPNLSFPMTAFLRLLPDEEGSHAHQTPQVGTTCKKHRAVLEFYDPLTGCDIAINDRLVPLQTDLSTPLAYFLSNPELTKWDLPTVGLLNPEETAKITGLYMLEPYNPAKIPVVFVHGLWSSPMTWMEMFNDLQGSPELRSRYQFMFYLYPTGQPFWDSAVQMRKDLAELRTRLDPQQQSATLEQMVLVGHSMGGLISRLQTIDSGDDFWRIVSDKPITELKGSPADRQALQELFYFEANPSLKRVVTIGTPHRGSEVSNNYTQWLGRKIISMPKTIMNLQANVIKENPDLFKNKELFQVNNSIESLSPKSKVLPVMLAAKKSPWVTYHNIVGRLPPGGYFTLHSDGDGVVEYTSARFPDAVSEIEVPEDHVNLHRHPLSVLEVRRILLEHKNSMPVVGPWKQRDMPNPTASQQRQNVLPASLQQQEVIRPTIRSNALPVNPSHPLKSGTNNSPAQRTSFPDQIINQNPAIGVNASDSTGVDVISLPFIDEDQTRLPQNLDPTHLQSPNIEPMIPMADLPSAIPAYR